MAVSCWMRRSGIGSLVAVRYKQRRELPSGMWSPVIFRKRDERAMTPEIRQHLRYNTCKTKINFGEYNGFPMGALPTHYLLYLANDFSSEEIHHWRFYRDMAKEVLRERRSLEICKRKEHLHRIIDAGMLDQALQILKEDGSQVDLPPCYAQLVIHCAKRSSLDDGLRVHEQMRWFGFSGNSYLAELLIVMYSKCGRLDLALDVFEKLPKKLVSSWTTMARCYIDHGKNQEALDLYKRMDVQPDVELLVTMFDCCGNLQALEEGRIIHACLLSSELRPNLQLRFSVFRFFARCGEVDVASKLFSNLEKKSVCCWAILIEAYVRAGRGQAALGIYREMDVAPDAALFVIVLPAAATLEQLDAIYADVVKHKLQTPEVRESYMRVKQKLETSSCEKQVLQRGCTSFEMKNKQDYR